MTMTMTHTISPTALRRRLNRDCSAPHASKAASSCSASSAAATTTPRQRAQRWGWPSRSFVCCLLVVGLPLALVLWAEHTGFGQLDHRNFHLQTHELQADQLGLKLKLRRGKVRHGQPASVGSIPTPHAHTCATA